MSRVLFTPVERGRIGGKASRLVTLAKMRAGRALQRAKDRAAKREEGAEPADAPLPSWLSGDKSGLPMRPPGKVTP